LDVVLIDFYGFAGVDFGHGDGKEIVYPVDRDKEQNISLVLADITLITSPLLLPVRDFYLYPTPPYPGIEGRTVRRWVDIIAPECSKWPIILFSAILARLCCSWRWVVTLRAIISRLRCS
jgi:hypothetical protein